MREETSIIQLVILILLVLFCPAVAKAAIGPIGPEIQVNQTTAGDQKYAFAAMDDAGNFVVVWVSEELSPTCATGHDYVMARIYNADGTPSTNEFQVNVTPVLYTQGSFLGGIDVAMDLDGDFVVVWSSGDSTDPCITFCLPPCADDHPDGEGTAVLGRRFNIDGVPYGPEFIVTSDTTENQAQPTVGMDESGNFTVAWMRMDYSVVPTGVSDIYMRRFQFDETPLTGDIMVNDVIADPDMQWPTIAMNRSGRSVIGWRYDCGSCADRDMHGKVFDENGTPQTGEITINTTTTGDQSSLRLAIRSNDSFIASWGSPDVSWGGTFAQLFDDLGNKAGPEFQVNTTTFFEQPPEGMALTSSTFFIFFSDASDLVNWVSKYQQYLYDGSPVGNESISTTTTTGDQGISDAAYREGSYFWAVGTSGIIDGDGSRGVFIRKFGWVQGPIPTVSDVGLIIMLVMILSILLIQIKRRQKKWHPEITNP